MRWEQVTAASSALARVVMRVPKLEPKKVYYWVVVKVEWWASLTVARLVRETVPAPGLASAAASARSSVRKWVMTSAPTSVATSRRSVHVKEDL